jgi:hypothetical protein
MRRSFDRLARAPDAAETPFGADLRMPVRVSGKIFFVNAVRSIKSSNSR